MKNNKGLTLVELLVSITLLGILTMSLLTALTSYFSFMNRTRANTEALFSAQGVIEREIETVKKDLEQGLTPSGAMTHTFFTDSTFFADLSINGFYRSESVVGAIELKTVIGEFKLPPMPLPEVVALNMSLRQSSMDIGKNYNYITQPTQDARAQATISDPYNQFLVNKHEWYISRPGFTVPMVDAAYIDEDFDLGRLYPLFPFDYIQVPIKSNEPNQLNQDIFNELDRAYDEFMGRHLIYTITPYSITGKKGDTHFSDPVFLHGPMYKDNLFVHLDASLISKNPLISSVQHVGDDVYVNRWDDVSGNSRHTNNLSVSGPRPKLVETQFREGVFSWGYSLIADVSSVAMRLNTLPSDILTGPRNFTLMLAIQAYQNPTPERRILEGNNGDWYLGWDVDGHLIFDYAGDRIILDGAQVANDQWHIVTLDVGEDYIGLRVNGTEVGRVPRTGDVVLGPIDMLWNDVAFGELIAYHEGFVSTGLVEAEAYLIDKYDPDPVAIALDIIMLRNPAPVKLAQNAPYTMPATLEAVMTNGVIQRVAVDWSHSIDTSVVGVQTATASARLNPSKTAVLTATVVGIESLIKHTNETIRINLDEVFPLPQRLDANMSDGTIMEVPVSWEAVGTPQLTVTGHTVMGTVNGMYIDSLKAYVLYTPTIEVSYDVEVSRIDVESVVITDHKAQMVAGETYTWGVSVFPTNAYNTDVTWSSSDETVASVSPEGIVTANLGGTAVIMVTSDDTGAFDFKEVTVRVPVFSILVNPTHLDMNVGQSHSLTATITPINATNQSVIWSSNDESVATVTQAGLVTAVGVGSTEIIVTSVENNSITSNASVVVGDSPLTVSINSHNRNSFSLTFNRPVTNNSLPTPPGRWSVSYSNGNRTLTYSRTGDQNTGSYTVRVNDGVQNHTINLSLNSLWWWYWWTLD